MLAGLKRRRPVMGVDGRRIDVPPEPNVGRETGRDAVVILRKQRGVPRAQVRRIRRVLLKCAGLAGDKVRNRITRAGRRGGREGNVAIIIQIGFEHGLVESELTAKGKVVLALGHADYVA